MQRERDNTRGGGAGVLGEVRERVIIKVTLTEPFLRGCKVDSQYLERIEIERQREGGRQIESKGGRQREGGREMEGRERARERYSHSETDRE